MLSRIETLSDNIVNLIVYVTSPSLEYFIKNMLKERFNAHKDFIVTVDTAKALQNAKLDSYIAPLFCDKWLIHVNADKLSKKDLFSALSKNTIHGITVYWTSKYMVFRQLIDSDTVKKQGVHCPYFSFSRLGPADIKYLHSKMVPQRRALNGELLDFVAKNYNFDVQAVCELFTLLKSGNSFETKRDVIEAIGSGGNTVGSLTLKILKSNFNSEKTRKRALSSVLKLIDDELSIKLDYSQIRRFMINTVEAFIDMKQLQLMGILNRLNKEIPETFDTKRLAMNKRFEQIVINEISLPKLLNLKLCLLNYNTFQAEIGLVQAISEYFNSLKVSK